MIETWKQRARQLKMETYAIYLAYRDPRVPWYARLFAACVVGYAFSPIDLIPDFIPVLGYLDDLIMVPVGIFFALKMIPPPVMVSTGLLISSTPKSASIESLWPPEPITVFVAVSSYQT